MAASSSIVDFLQPPVVEVVWGVQFAPLSALRSAHLGVLWQRLREDFPSMREAPPLPAVLENMGGTDRHVAELQYAFESIAGGPRVLLTDRSGRQLLQVQNGRFHYNWQRLHGADEYIRHPQRRPMFERRWQEFGSFVSSEQLGALRPVQYEMSYINHVAAGELWDEARGIEGVVPWFAPRNPVVGNVFEPEFALHSPAEACRGRLHVTGKTGVRADGTRVLVLELVVRGAPSRDDDSDLLTWMDAARSYIVRSFVELTSENARRRWGQQT